MGVVLETGKLCVGYSRKGMPDYRVMESLDLRIQAGQVVCILGPNGSGKSTLIRSLSGMQPVLSGHIRIMGESVDFRHPKKLSRLLSVVLTDPVDVRNLTVYELVEMGRYPYSSWFGRVAAAESRLIEQSLEQVHLLELSGRPIHELSDGELQRAMIAKALAQDTPIILLDEPTAHLDMPNRIQTMQLLRKLAQETGKAVLLSTHDHELALQSADLLWLIRKNGPILTGLPEDLVLNGSFEETFLTEDVRFDPESGSYRINYPTRRQMGLVGNSIRGFWTRRAFEREGIDLNPAITTDCCVHILAQAPHWGTGPAAGPDRTFESIEELIRHIRRETLTFAADKKL